MATGVGNPFVPDYNTMGGSTYPLTIDGAIAAGRRLAFPFAPHETNPVSLQVRLHPGATLDAAGQLVELGEQLTPVFSAPGANPRIDLIVVDANTGILAVVAGAEAASPSPPALPAGKLPVAYVDLTVGQTEIRNTDLSDIRLPLPPQNAGFPNAPLFESAPIAPVASTRMSWEHGLAAAPSWINATLTCVTADGNYPVGTVIPLHQIGYDGAAAGSQGLTLSWDATHVYVQFSGLIRVGEPNSGSAMQALTPSRWRVQVKAY